MCANIFIVGSHKLDKAFISITGLKTQKDPSEAVHLRSGDRSVGSRAPSTLLLTAATADWALSAEFCH